jgi:Predicted membrane protein (DUF2306)
MLHERVERTSRLAFTGWVFLTFLATAIGLFSLRYALPTAPFMTGLPNFRIRHGWLVAHAIFASIALLAGPWQFLPSLRRRWPVAHRWTGRVYCGSVVVGWVASVPVAAHASTGAVASAGFLTLGVFWIATTAAGYLTARSGKFLAHRDWMVRSYALTAAAITLRIYMPLFAVAGIPYAISYPIIAWLCWIANLIFAEWLIGRRRVAEAVGPIALSSVGPA